MKYNYHLQIHCMICVPNVSDFFNCHISHIFHLLIFEWSRRYVKKKTYLECFAFIRCSHDVFIRNLHHRLIFERITNLYIKLLITSSYFYLISCEIKHLRTLAKMYGITLLFCNLLFYIYAMFVYSVGTCIYVNK